MIVKWEAMFWVSELELVTACCFFPAQIGLVHSVILPLGVVIGLLVIATLVSQRCNIGPFDRTTCNDSVSTFIKRPPPLDDYMMPTQK